MHKRIQGIVVICMLACSIQAVAQEASRPKPPPIVWDVIGPGADASAMPPGRTTSAGVVIHVLTGSEKATEELAVWIERNGINRQADGYGDIWAFDPRRPEAGWGRMAKVEAQAGGPIEDRVMMAGLRLANYLNYKATTAAVTLSLSESKQDNPKP